VPKSQELKDKIADAREGQRTIERVQKMKATFAAGPRKPGDAKRLAELYILELDDPAGAAEFALAGDDAALGGMIALCVKPASELTEAELLQLAGWYESLAKDASIAGQVLAYGKSQKYYQEFLAVHDAKDGQRLQAVERLETVGRHLAAALAKTSSGSGDRIVIWNQYNGKEYQDRGTNEINLSLMSGGRPVWSKRGVVVPWQGGEDTFVSVNAPRVAYDVLRIEIVSWHKLGGGLAEIEVYRSGQNIAKGAQVAVSKTPAGSPPPSMLVDGITTSARVSAGYWILPDKTPGTIDIQIKSR
jgi:hypothetical protein